MKKKEIDFMLRAVNNFFGDDVLEDTVSIECYDYYNTPKDSEEFELTITEQINEIPGGTAGESFNMKDIFYFIFKMEQKLKISINCEILFWSDVVEYIIHDMEAKKQNGENTTIQMSFPKDGEMGHSVLNEITYTLK
jgi:hypothetical protein